MNETQEYRKASAEAIGIEHSKPADGDDIWLHIVKNDYLVDEIWQPDKDANQREMIEDWLDSQSCILYYDNEDYHTWTIIPMVKGRPKFTCYDKSKSIAFMKAFMEYIKK